MDNQPKKKLPVSALTFLPQLVGLLNGGEIDLQLDDEKQVVSLLFNDQAAYSKLKGFVKTYAEQQP